MKADKWLRVITVFLLVIQIALLFYFTDMVVHYVSLGNTSGVVSALSFAIINISGIIINIFSSMD